jgi:hypothetical protein
MYESNGGMSHSEELSPQYYLLPAALINLFGKASFASSPALLDRALVWVLFWTNLFFGMNTKTFASCYGSNRAAPDAL